MSKQQSIAKQVQQSMEEFRKHKNGKPSQTKVVKVRVKEIPSYDGESIVALREKLGLTQAAFATVMGVSPRTVESWEQGRSHPQGNSERLMSLIENNPSLLEEIIEFV